MKGADSVWTVFMYFYIIVLVMFTALHFYEKVVEYIKSRKRKQKKDMSNKSGTLKRDCEGCCKKSVNGSKYYELFEHMNEEHGLTLLESEMEAIVDKALKIAGYGVNNKASEEVSIAKRVLLDELEEQSHPERVEDVIFWALEAYSEGKNKTTWGRVISFTIKERILKEEGKSGKGKLGYL